MDLFTFILILVGIITMGEVATKVGVPLVRRLGDLVGEPRRPKAAAAETSPELPAAIEALEVRLARIEDRLDFLEELKAAPRQPALTEGSRQESRT